LTELNLNWVAEVTEGRLMGRATTAEGVAIDSRKVRAGQLFFALVGAREDGHAHIGAALEAGAVAVVVSRPSAYGCPTIVVPDTGRALRMLARAYINTQKAKIVAITGSVGKTSCKEMTAAALSSQFTVLKSAGNQNTEIGLPISVLSHQKEEVMVLEMAMRGIGQVAELAKIASPDIAVITNVGEAHIELLGSRDNIARAKGEILQGSKRGGIAILNRDDDYFKYLSSVAKGPVLSFGSDGQADWNISELTPVELGHYSFLLRTGQREYAVRCPWPGRHQVYNAAAALVAASVLGVDVSKAVLSLAACAPSEQRFNIIMLEQGVTLIDDTYNAGPASMLAALNALAETKAPGRRIAVLGSMFELGARSRAAHQEVGSAAATLCDIVITVGAEAQGIAAQVSSQSDTAVFACQSPDEATQLLRRELRPGDVVLVKGSRGLRLEQIVFALSKGAGSDAK